MVRKIRYNDGNKIKMKKVGLALGGGGACGLFHVGLTDVLRENNVKIGQIVGTSMGAIVGAMVACGIESKVLTSYLREKLLKNPVSLKNLNRHYTSLVNPHELEDFLDYMFGDRLMENCAIPFSCMVIDLEAGKLLEVKEGLISKAVRASASLPFILPPVYYNERLMIDGGLLDNVPVDRLRDELCNFKIAVRLDSLKNRSKLSAITFNEYIAPKKKTSFRIGKKLKNMLNSLELMVETVLRSLEIASHTLTDAELKKAKIDLLIEQQFNYGILEFERSEEAIAKGREVMKAHLKKITG